MIKIENLTKKFRTTEVETIALNKVSLEVNDKEFVAIMGPSGCGKSTLLNILGLLDNPTDGNYYLDGNEVGHLKEKDRTNVRKGSIGFVFQSFNLIDELNVFENVELPLTYLKVPAEERKKRVSEILSRMNISHRAVPSNSGPRNLSAKPQSSAALSFPAGTGSDARFDYSVVKRPPGAAPRAHLAGNAQHQRILVQRLGSYILPLRPFDCVAEFAHANLLEVIRVVKARKVRAAIF